MNHFCKFLLQAYARLEDIAKNPYPDPTVDSVTVAMLIESTNKRARQAGCGHLAVPRDAYQQRANIVDLEMRAIEKMLAWCKAREA